MEALTEELAAVEATGVTVKDLEIGLCDFLGRVAGREAGARTSTTGSIVTGDISASCVRP